MLNKISEYIAMNHMIEQGDRVVVGVSGGADSVCLLYALNKLYSKNEITLFAVHVNHGIRGEEADRDEQYVKELCRNLEIEYYPFFCDVRRVASEHSLSEEEAGRKVRYDAFIEVCRRQKCNKIAVAHNKNDNAETVLFHLFRGTGLKGLAGIEPNRVISEEWKGITLIRPLLGVERKEIEAFLKKDAIDYETDSTNLTEDYSRNKIRNRILSYVTKEINTGAVGNIAETAAKISEAWEYIDMQIMQRFPILVSRDGEAYFFDQMSFMQEPAIIQKGILRKILEKLAGGLKDLESKHINSILSLTDKQVGRVIHLPYGIKAEREYERIKLYRTDAEVEKPESKPMETISLEIPGRTIIPQKRKILETKLIKYEKNEPIPKNSCMKWFDYDKIENAVEIRSRKEGDYIQVNALGGHKKLKDYFIDHKVPQKQRDSQILITDGNHVMWIPGDWERMSEKYKVDETTKNVLLIKMFDLEED